MNQSDQNSTPEIRGRWSMRKRDLGTAIWVAFLAACAGTFVIFGVLDPDAMNEAWMLPWEMGRKLTYSLGFLFLFVVGLIASSLTIFMIRTGPRRGHTRGSGRRQAPEIKDPGEDNPDLDIGDWH
jgi:hypothetical protein